MTHLQDNEEFREFKDKEKDLQKNIEEHKDKITKKNRSFEELNEKLAQLKTKNEIREKLRLRSDKDKITNKYNKLNLSLTQVELID